jgi:hypothetical protein
MVKMAGANFVPIKLLSILLYLVFILSSTFLNS